MASRKILNMSPIQFLKSFLFQTIFSAVVLAMILISAEIFVPGSVLPFVDLVDLLPVVLSVVFVGVMIGRAEG